MALVTAAVQVGAAAIAAGITKIRLHTASPSGTSGAGVLTTAADQTVTATATGGVVTIPSTAFTGGAASGPCTYVSVWAGTTYWGFYALTGDQTFNAAGQYTVSSVTVTGSST